MSVDDFVVMHRDSEMHKNKLAYAFLGLYEVIRSMVSHRLVLKKVGSNVVTKAAKEQLRLWPANWSLTCVIVGVDEGRGNYGRDRFGAYRGS